jgi:hypothetical protein
VSILHSTLLSILQITSVSGVSHVLMSNTILIHMVISLKILLVSMCQCESVFHISSLKGIISICE